MVPHRASVDCRTNTQVNVSFWGNWPERRRDSAWQHNVRGKRENCILQLIQYNSCTTPELDFKYTHCKKLHLYCQDHYLFFTIVYVFKDDRYVNYSQSRYRSMAQLKLAPFKNWSHQWMKGTDFKNVMNIVKSLWVNPDNALNAYKAIYLPVNLLYTSVTGVGWTGWSWTHWL